mgnify:FL=1
MQLSKNFTLEELTFSDAAMRHGIDNTPNDEIIENLKRLCALVLEPIREIVHKPVQVTSGYRCPIVNSLVGSKVTSQHIRGCAADIKVSGVTPDVLIKAIIGAGLPYEQVIREFDSWVHVSVPNDPHALPKRQALIIDKSGTKPYT